MIWIHNLKRSNGQNMTLNVVHILIYYDVEKLVQIRMM